jgi:hypothetical protein
METSHPIKNVSGRPLIVNDMSKHRLQRPIELGVLHTSLPVGSRLVSLLDGFRFDFASFLEDSTGPESWTF